MVHTALAPLKGAAMIDVKRFTGAAQVRAARSFCHTQNYNGGFSCHRDDELRPMERFAESGKTRMCAIRRVFHAGSDAACSLLCPHRMFRSRSAWLRVLRLYETPDSLAPAGAALDEHLSLPEARVHARSRFRSVGDPGRFALYSVHNGDSAPLLALAAPSAESEGEHTLVAVREFRRVPLAASSLALTVFTARNGRAVQVVAAIAHFVERAVDLYQPGYLLLAHSLEEPRICLLLTAVHDSSALGAGATAAFSLDTLLAELTPFLLRAPETYEYCPEEASEPALGAVSPYAV
ncbi:MAG TPA: hypothetical protein VFW70_12300, partial [Methylomirabilota bacterium]|nr:hypothetical protein [Methylomirabilota bacterium]